MKRWAATMLREPLLHFLIVGALLFAAMAGRAPDAGERRIVVDEAVVAGIVNHHVRAFRRPPTAQELDALIRDHVRSEVYYREALRLGLDADDDVVKKRLRNKMLAIAGAEAEATRPTDADLQTLLDADPAHYALPLRFSFAQRYLGADSAALRAQAMSALARGRTETLASEPFPLPARLNAAAHPAVAEQFGDDFAAALAKAPIGQWQLLPSGFGLHLVRLDQRIAPPPPRLSDVRQRLENDWRSAAVRKAQDAQLQALISGYQIEIERPS
jgi:peptidyl-prolyl cis-trans isomerase C